MLRVIYGPALLVLVGLSGCLWQEVPGINGVLAWDRVELIAELNEPIVHIEAREGQRLRAGDLILQQDDRLMAARLAEARAQLDQARGRLAELRRGPRMERIAAAQASLEGAEAEAGNAARELQRIERLQQQHLTSVEAVDLARTRASSADARVQVVRAALDELRHGSTREELEQAEAQVQQARARMAQLQRGSRAEVRVDGVARVFDGQIRRISADASFTPFNSLTERDRSRLSYLAEVELSGDGTESLPAGLPVQVRFEGLSL